MNTSAFHTTFRFSLLDLRHSRWPAMLLAIVAIAAGAGLFAGQLGLTEQQAIALSITAPVARLLGVLLVTVLIVAAMAREAAERTRQLALSTALSRRAWLLAKSGSFAVMALGTAAACTATVLLLAGTDALPAVLAWGASLALELAIVSAIAMTIVLALEHVAASVVATLAIYAAARLVGVILLLNSRGPMVEHAVLGGVVELPLQLLAALLPRLDLFARTDWLLGQPVEQFGAQCLQAVIYGVLMHVVAFFDFRRRDI